MVALAEEGRAKPDDVSMTLRFVDLDLNQLLSGADKAYLPRPPTTPLSSLRLEAKRGTNIDARVDAKQVAYGAARIADVAMHLRLTSGEATLDQLAFAFAGGGMDASGSALAVAGGSHVVARGVLAGADAAQLSQFVDALAGRIGGKVNGAFTMDMAGDTLGNALRAGRGHAVLGMVQGSVSRDLMEKLSVNLLNLLRRGEGSVQVACLLGVVDLRNGGGGSFAPAAEKQGWHSDRRRSGRYPGQAPGYHHPVRSLHHGISSPSTYLFASAAASPIPTSTRDLVAAGQRARRWSTATRRGICRANCAIWRSAIPAYIDSKSI